MILSDGRVSFIVSQRAVRHRGSGGGEGGASSGVAEAGAFSFLSPWLGSRESCWNVDGLVTILPSFPNRCW